MESLLGRGTRPLPRLMNTAYVLMVTLLLCRCAGGGNQSGAQLTLHVGNLKEYSPATLTIAATGEDFPLAIDSTGYAHLTVSPKDQGFYATLYYRYVARPLYLTPQSDLTLTFNEDTFAKEIQIDGPGAPENRFLNNPALNAPGINDTGRSEESFISLADSLVYTNLRLLAQAARHGTAPTNEAPYLDEAFAKGEMKRIIYFTYATLPSYPYFHPRLAQDPDYKPTDVFWKKLETLAVLDNSLMGFREYQAFLTEAIPLLARRAYPQLKGAKATIAYLEAAKAPTKAARTPKNDLAISYVAHTLLCSLVNRYGMEAVTNYKEAYHRLVNQPLWTAQFNALCAKWDRMAPGQPSPSFKATNIDGREVTLEDFKGNYVYIDIWATWCVPCKQEIPHLQQLEKDFHGKALCFVSLSCDKDRSAWEQFVKEKLTGNQLHLTAEDPFMEAYSISSIPRFILLDPQGRIVNHQMTRPSDPATRTTLEALFN